MRKEFDAEQFDLVDADSVHVPDHAFGHNKRGELDVWTTKGATGTAFVSQTTVNGVAGPLRQGVYGAACYFLREKTTKRFFFLERDTRGFYLHGEDFFGARTYFGVEAAKLDAWLAGRPGAKPRASGHTITDKDKW
jgi:hypothetical protein